MPHAPPQQPPAPGGMPHGIAGADAPLEDAVDAAKTDSFLTSRVDPQAGHGVPFQSEDRTSTSLSFPHALQWNSNKGMATSPDQLKFVETAV